MVEELRGFQEGRSVRPPIFSAPLRRLDMRERYTHDLPLQQALSREAWITECPKMGLSRLDRFYLVSWDDPRFTWDKETVAWDQNVDYDQLFGEAVSPVYQKPIYLPVWWERITHKQALTKYGVDEKFDLVFKLSTVILGEMGLESDLHPGDKFLFDGQDYVVVTVIPEQRWGNTNVPLQISCLVKRYRPGV